MRFMVMHKVDAKMEAGEPPDTSIIGGMGAYVRDSLKRGVFEDGAGLHRSAMRARVTAGGVTRGPYDGGNNLVASFAMVKASSLDHATELARRLAADTEVEIGPVVEAWDLKLAPKPERAPERFLLLRKGDAAYEAGTPEPAANRAVLDEWKRDGVLLASGKLAPSSQGARYRKVAGKREWSDGPFTESKELIAGYSILNLPSVDEVKRWAEAYADILGDNEVDIRRVVE